MERLNMKEKRNYEIIKKWDDGKINYKRAKIILGYSTRHMYRLKDKYRKKGKDGFVHGNRGRKPKITIDQSLSNNILQYYIEEFQGFNFNHYRIMLLREKDIEVSYSKIYKVLTIENGILSPRAKKKTKKKFKKFKLLNKRKSKTKLSKELKNIISRQIEIEDATPSLPRTINFGENIELDASSFYYFGDTKTHLHLSIDTSSNVCTGAYIDHQETLNGYYNVAYQILTNYGIPIMFTTDGRTIFDYMSKKMKKDENAYFTQFKHACDTLGIDLRVTSKAQGKPRVEKYNDTFQDRLSKELHYHNITDIESANRYLIDIFIPEFNKLFGRKIDNKNNVFEKIDNVESLNFILSVLSIRQFNNGSAISYKGKTYLPYNENNELTCYLKGTKCTVIEAFDKNIYVQVYNEIFRLIELKETLSEGETLQNYFESFKRQDKNTLPKAQHDWEESKLDIIFEKINKEYDIYDSHNPKI